MMFTRVWQDVPFKVYNNHKFGDEFREKFEKYKADREDEIPEELFPIKELYENIEFDRDEALNWMNQKAEEGFKLRAKRIKYKGIMQKTLDSKTVSEWQKKIDDLDYFYFRHHSETGRVFSNMTNMCKPLRKFASINGKSIVGVDVSNSQPLLLCLLVEKWAKESGIELGEDFYGYKVLCETGQFYKYFKKELEKDKINLNKEVFKQDFFTRILFSKENKNRVYNFRKKFKELFPTVDKYLSVIKAEEHRDCAIALQRIEADIIINRVCKRLLNEEFIEFFPLHDAIYCTEGNEIYVKRVMREEFQKYGVQVSVETEKCD